MIFHFLSIAIRYALRQKIYTLINILGLCLGIVVSIRSHSGYSMKSVMIVTLTGRSGSISLTYIAIHRRLEPPIPWPCFDTTWNNHQLLFGR